jgi:hypothetical protein
VSELPSKPTFSEEISLCQNAKACLLSGVGHYDKPYLSLLDKKQCAGLIALSEYDGVLLVRQHVPTPPGGRKKGVGIEVTHLVLRRDFVSHGAAFAGCMLAPLSSNDEA